MEFSTDEEAWLQENPDIKLGKELGSGVIGRVYELANNPGLVVKVPNKFIPQSEFEEKYWPIDHRTAVTRMAIRQEIENYERFKHLRIIAPTRVVKLGIKTAKGKDYLGLIRPKLNTSNSDLKALSDAQLFDLRENLINLSEAGCWIRGRLQVGISKAGELQIFDMGLESMVYREDKESVFDHNNLVWRYFLSEIEQNFWDYGKISPARI